MSLYDDEEYDDPAALMRAAGETSQCPEEMVVDEFEREEERRRRAEEDHQEEEEEEEEKKLGSQDANNRIVVQNVVATANLRCAIDLKQLTLSARNAEYNPKKFSAVIMRIREPRCTALIFSTGKMVCTGAKSERDARQGARKFGAIIRRLGYAPRFTEFVVQNVVATADVGFPIRLESLVYAHAKFSSYEPELFPGCVYRLVVPKTVLLLFVSGRMVITGAKSVRQLRTAFDKIYPVLCDYRKETLTNDRFLAINNASTEGGPLVDVVPATTAPTPQPDDDNGAIVPRTGPPPRKRIVGAPRIGRSGRRPNSSHSSSSPSQPAGGGRVPTTTELVS